MESRFQNITMGPSRTSVGFTHNFDKIKPKKRSTAGGAQQQAPTQINIYKSAENCYTERPCDVNSKLTTPNGTVLIKCECLSGEEATDRLDSLSKNIKFATVRLTKRPLYDLLKLISPLFFEFLPKKQKFEVKFFHKFL